MVCTAFGGLGARGIYRGLGGCGLGTPVVSYAPRPMFASVVSRSIMKASKGTGVDKSADFLEKKKETIADGPEIYNNRKRWMGATLTDSQIDLGCVREATFS